MNAIKSFLFHVVIMLALVVFLIVRGLLILAHIIVRKPWRREL